MYDDWTYADRDAVRARRQQAVQQARANRQAREQGTPVAPYASRLNTLSAPPVAGKPSPAPGNPFTTPFAGGSGPLGGLKKAGSRALGVLDAATETTTDLADTFVGGPGSAAINLAGGDFKGAAKDIANPLDVIPGVRALRKGVFNPAREGDAPGAAKALKPGDYLRRQREDYEKRPLGQQIATGVLLDPTNVIGGMGAAKGLRAAAKGRGAVAGKVLRGAAKADEFADKAQAKVAREVLGGTAGLVGNQVAGGEDVTGLEWWQAAAIGALGGHMTRGAKAPLVQAAGKATSGGFGGSVIQDVGPMKRPDLERLPHGEVTTRPDLFQAKNVTEGKSYNEDQVKDILSRFDQNELTPGILVNDTSSGEMVVMAGHHRLEVQKRLNAQGKWPAEGTWEVFDADLSNPEHVKYLARLADESNTNVAKLSFGENLNVYRRGLARGSTHDQAIGGMRNLSRQDADDLRQIHGLPDDVVDVVVAEPALADVAAEIGRARSIYKITDTDVRGLFRRYGEKPIKRTELRRILDAYGRIKATDNAAKAQGGFGGDDWAATESRVLTSIDEMVRIEGELATQKRKLTALRNGLQKMAVDDPDLREHAGTIVTALEARIKVTEEALTDARAGHIQAAVDRFEGRVSGRPGPGVPEGDVGAAPRGPEATVKRADLDGNVTDTGQTERELNGWGPGTPDSQTAFDMGAPEMRTKGPGVAEDTRDVFGNRTDGADASDGVSPDFEYDDAAAEAAYERSRAEIDARLPAARERKAGAVKALYEALVRDLTAGKEVITATQYKATRLRSPDQIRLSRDGQEIQFQAGGKQGWLGMPDMNHHASLRGMESPFEAFARDDVPVPKVGETPIPEGQVGDSAPDLQSGAVARTETPAGGEEAIGNAAERQGSEGPQPASGPPPREGPFRAKEEPKAPPKQEAPPRQPPPPLDTTNDFTTLGLDPTKTYTIKEVQKAFRARMMQYHPDVGGTDVDAKAINAAFQRFKLGREKRGTSGAGPQSSGSRAGSGAGTPPPPPPPPGAGPRASGPGSAPPNAGVPPRGATGGPTSPPPPPPGAPPPPPPPRGPATGTPGANPKDLFTSKPRREQLRDFDAWGKTWRGKVAAAVREIAANLGGERIDRNLKFDRLIHPFKQELNRVQNFRQSFLEQVDLIRADATKAGLLVKQTATGWRLDGFAGNPTFEDVIEQATPAGQRAWAMLTPEQRAVMDKIKGLNQDINDTVKFHGGELHLDADIDGTYFPRIVLDKNGMPKAAGANPNSAAFGRKQGHNRTRAFESLEEGLAAGYNYEDPWSALRAGWDSKLRTAQDAYVHNMLSPLKSNMATPPWGAREVRGHPAFQGEVFDADIADKIEAMLSKPGNNVFTATPKTINAVLTPLRSTLDFSAGLQQGAGFMVQHPIEGPKLWGAAIASMRDPEIYYGNLRRLDAKGPGLSYLQQMGFHMRGGVDEEMLFPRLAAKLTKGKVQEIPVLGKVARTFNDQFSRTLNLFGAHEANNLHERLVKSGLTGTKLDDEMKKGMASVNRMMGWSARKPTLVENIGVFAPRYTSATFEQLAAAVTKGGIEGSVARRHLVSLLGAGGLMVYGYNTLRGRETEFDPRAGAKWMTVQVGGLNVSPFGSYSVLMRGIAQTLAGAKGDSLNPLESFDPGRAGKFAWAKMSPTVKILWETFGSKETYLGEPIDTFGSPEGFGKSVAQQAKSSLPFSAQNLADEGPVAAAVGATGLSASPMSASQKRDLRRDEVARKQFGKPYKAISGEQKSRVNEDAVVQRWTKAGQEQALKRTGDFATYSKVQKLSREELAAAGRFFTAGKNDAGKTYTGRDYRSAVHDITQRRIGALRTLKEFSQDSELSGYFKLYDKAKNADGSPDYEKFDRLAAAYVAEHPGVQAKVDGIVGANDDPVMRELRAARKTAHAYYQIPRYRGMTLEEGNRAAELMGQLNDLVRFGQAKNRAQAYRLLEEASPGSRALVRRALARGVNPERKAFLKAHPEMAKFYSDAPLAAAA